MGWVVEIGTLKGCFGGRGWGLGVDRGWCVSQCEAKIQESDGNWIFLCLVKGRVCEAGCR